MADSRQRAMAPKCETSQCGRPGAVANHYGRGRASAGWALCTRHRASYAKISSSSYYDYDRYEPLILAHVGDSVWTALECAFAFLAGQHEPMTLDQQYAYNDSIPAMLTADGYATQLEPHGPSEAMWPRRAA